MAAARGAAVGDGRVDLLGGAACGARRAVGRQGLHDAPRIDRRTEEARAAGAGRREPTVRDRWRAVDQRRRDVRRRPDAARRRRVVRSRRGHLGCTVFGRLSAAERRRSAALALARGAQSHPPGDPSRAGRDCGGAGAPMVAVERRACRGDQSAQSVATVQPAHGHVGDDLREPHARGVGAPAGHGIAARHRDRRRALRIPVAAAAPPRLGPAPRPAAEPRENLRRRRRTGRADGPPRRRQLESRARRQ